MKKFTRGLLIFALFIFVVGIGCVVAGLTMGVTSGDLKQMVDKYIPYFNEKYIEEQIIISEDTIDEIPDASDSEGTTPLEGKIYEFDGSEVEEIELDLSNIKCNILPSDTNKVIVVVEEEKDFVSVRMNRNSLEVECDPAFWDDKETVDISMYLPSDLHLKEFYMTAGAGKVTMDTNIFADEVFMEMGAGKIISNQSIQAGKFELEIGAGNGEFALVDAADIHAENAAGTTKLHLAGQKEMYNVTMEVAAGTVQYGEEKYAGLAQEFSENPKDAAKSIDIECAAGTITITFDHNVAA